MKQAQAAWVALSAVFVICGTVIRVGAEEEAGVAGILFGVGILGWLALTAMIFWDKRL